MRAHPSIAAALPRRVVVRYAGATTAVVEALAPGAMMAAPAAASEED